MDVLKLLQKKNGCLRKFLELSTAFAESPDLDHLQRFQYRREATLKAVELYDRGISDAVGRLSLERTPELIEGVKLELAEKDLLVHQILEVDLKIISWIEKARADVMREMATVQRSRKATSKFKSTWIGESGDSLDEKL